MSSGHKGAAAAAQGGAKKQRPRKEKPVLEQVQVGSDAGNSKFARALGSTDYGTREKGLTALLAWLCVKEDLEEIDMMKIWKGLFFCFWHSDKAPVQVGWLLLLALGVPH
jgi:ribosomal RNA-processing protein 1